MLKGRMVRIRMRRSFVEQKLWNFVGRVKEFTENWVFIQDKGLVLTKGKTSPDRRADALHHIAT